MEDEQDGDCFCSEREAGRGWLCGTSFSPVIKYKKATKCLWQVIYGFPTKLQLNQVLNNFGNTETRENHHTHLYVITELVIPEPKALICGSNSLHSSGFRLHTRFYNLAAGILLPLSHKSVCEVGHWCWVMRPGSQRVLEFIPEVLDGFEVRSPCKKTISVWIWLYAWGRFHVGARKKTSSSCWKHTTAYKHQCTL